MATDLPDADVPRPNALQRVLASTRHRLLAAVAAATLLVVGYAARPEERVAARAEQAPAPLLREVVEQRAPQSVFRALQRVGRESLPFVARVEAPPRPLESWSDVAARASRRPPQERYGVIVGPEEILADGTGLVLGDAVTLMVGDGRLFGGTVTAHFRERALALITVDTPSPLAVPDAAAAVAPGDAVVAAGPGEQGHVVAPLFVAAVTRSGILAATPLEAFRGMGVFDEAGAVAGIIGLAAEGLRILPIEEALEPLPFREPPPPALGVSLTLTDTATGDRAVEITEVAPGGMAARLGLRQGDVLLAEEGGPVRTVEAALSMLNESELPGRRLRVLRGSRTITLRRAPALSDSRR